MSTLRMRPSTKSKPESGELALFFTLLIALSAFAYYPMIRAHSIRAGAGTLLLMWSPGLAALATRLSFRRSLRGFGWWLGKRRWLLLAWALPIGCALVAYAAVWISGLGGVPNSEFLAKLLKAHPGASSTVAVSEYLVNLMIVWFVPTMIKPLGEELGWRGFLVPLLAKKMSYAKLSLLIGAIWAVWHYPAILLTDYNIGTPVWFAIPCFSAMVVAASFVASWLRLRSDSVWPSVIWHNSHNAIVQAFFTPITRTGPLTLYFIDEFGIGLVLTIGVAALVCWKLRASLPSFAREVGELGDGVHVPSGTFGADR